MKYGVWVDLIRDRTRLRNAFLFKRLALRGETEHIYGPTVLMFPEPLFEIELRPAAERNIEVAGSIPTEFIGEVCKGILF